MSSEWRWTRQRRKVLEVLAARDDHPTAEDLYGQLRTQGEPISLATVYRTLRSLEQEELARALHGPGADRFDARTDAHYHIVCNACRRTVDLELPYQTAVDQAARNAGAQVGEHVLLFLGRCPDCVKAGRSDLDAQDD